MIDEVSTDTLYINDTNDGNFRQCFMKEVILYGYKLRFFDSRIWA